jgi:HK97 family phage prohead protease
MVDTAVLRAQAAQARREAIQDASPEGIQRARGVTPLDVGWSRSLTFPATLRAVPAHREGADPDSTPWLYLSGIASVTETPYEMWDAFGPYVETVARSAFDESLSRNPDVAFLVNHTGLTMARTVNSTLKLGSGKQGLTVEAWLNPDRTDVGDLARAINDGHIDQMSFGGQLEDGKWSSDFTAFNMTKVNLHCGDVSAVNFGANPYTSIASRAHRFLTEIDRLPSGAALAALRHLELRFNREPPKHKDESDEVPEIHDFEAAQPAPGPMGRSLTLVRCALEAGVV